MPVSSDFILVCGYGFQHHKYVVFNSTLFNDTYSLHFIIVLNHRFLYICHPNKQNLVSCMFITNMVKGHYKLK